MPEKKAILITGASGFIGTWLAEKAFEQGYKLIGIDTRAPLNPNYWSAFATSVVEHTDIAQYVGGNKLSAVFHLAGGASVASSVNDPYSDFSGLMPATAKLALYVSKFHPQARLFLFSSAAVYGNPAKLPITVQSSITPVSPYGVHKALAEFLLFQYAAIFPLNVTVLRIFSVFGPGLKKQIVWDIFQKVQEATGKGCSKITLWGTGRETRDFIYVEDLCKAVLLILGKKNFSKTEYYNIASGTETSIDELSNRLINHLHPGIEVFFNGNFAKGDPLNWKADISELEKIGFIPEFSLDRGLQKVCKWISKDIKQEFLIP